MIELRYRVLIGVESVVQILLLDWLFSEWSTNDYLRAWLENTKLPFFENGGLIPILFVTVIGMGSSFAILLTVVIGFQLSRKIAPLAQPPIVRLTPITLPNPLPPPPPLSAPVSSPVSPPTLVPQPRPMPARPIRVEPWMTLDPDNRD